MTDKELIKRIQDALGTAEEGDALVEVARNAHRAEQELAAAQRELQLRPQHQPVPFPGDEPFVMDAGPI